MAYAWGKGSLRLYEDELVYVWVGPKLVKECGHCQRQQAQYQDDWMICNMELEDDVGGGECGLVLCLLCADKYQRGLLRNSKG